MEVTSFAKISDSDCDFRKTDTGRSGRTVRDFLKGTECAAGMKSVSEGETCRGEDFCRMYTRYNGQWCQSNG